MDINSISRCRFIAVHTSDASQHVDLPMPPGVTQLNPYNPALRQLESQFASNLQIVNRAAETLRAAQFQDQTWQRRLAQAASGGARPLLAAINRLAPDIFISTHPGTAAQTGSTIPAVPPIDRQQLQQQSRQNARNHITRSQPSSSPERHPIQPQPTPQRPPPHQQIPVQQTPEDFHHHPPSDSVPTQKRRHEEEFTTQRPPKRSRQYTEYEGSRGPAPMKPQDVADKCAASLWGFLAEAAQFCDVHLQVGTREELKGMPWVRLEDIRGIQKSVQMAKKADALDLVPATDLKEVLSLLRHHVLLGGSELVPDDANETTQSYQSACMCLESMITSLGIITTPGIPNEVVEEELLLTLLDATRYHLVYNVLAVYDPTYRSKYRPGKFTGPTNARSRSSAVVRSRATENILGRIEKVLELLADMQPVRSAPTERMIPLLQTAMHTLQVDYLKTLQLKAVGFVVSVYQFNTDLRDTVLDLALTEGLSAPTSSKAPPRLYLALNEPSQIYVQMHTALLVQLIQVSGDVPWSGNMTAVMDCSKPCFDVMFRICNYLLDRLPLARAQKADSSVDFKAFVEEFLKDLLDMQCLPDWPAANQLLRWFVTMLKNEKGMGHPDANVKSMAIDFLGQVVQRLCRDAKVVEEEDPQVQALLDVEVAGLEADEKAVLEPAQKLLFVLLGHLARQPSKLSASARQFAECVFISEQFKDMDKEGGLDAEVFTKVMDFLRLMHQRHSNGVVEDRLVPDQAAMAQVCRAIMQLSKLGAARVSMLCWLAEAGDRSKQDANAATARSRAIKKLAAAIEEDLRVLGLEEVRTGVKGALQDDSVMVREAAVELIGKYISSDHDLAEQYFDVVAVATADMGLSVRKRAIKILWECCVKVKDFPRLLDACVRIIYRAADNDASIRTMVTRICSQLWFNPGTCVDGGTEQLAARPVSERAKQFSEVANALLDLNNRRLPFASDHPLVLIVKQVVGQEGKPEYAEAKAGAQEVAEALLQMLLEAEGGSDPAAALPILLGLHTLSMAMPALLAPDKEPDKFVSTLAPYLKESCTGPIDENRPVFERLTCILAIINKVCGVLDRLDKELLMSMCRELFTELIGKCNYILVVMLACQTVSTLTRFSSSFKEIISFFGKVVKQFAVYVEQMGLKGGRLKFAARGVSLIGYLCRYGADAIDQAAAGDAAAMTVEKCLELVLRAWKYKDSPLDGSQKLTEDCVQALGMMFISRPRMLLERPDVMSILTGSLSLSSPANLKQKALLNLVELVKAEEDQLVTGQQKQQANNSAAAQGEIPIEKVTQLATQNGEGDSLGMSSGIVQMVLENVLQLMQDVAPEATGHAANMQIAVRRTALELVEAVLKGGQCAPWKAIASLVAAATDPCDTISAKALATLKLATERYADFASNQLAPGIEATYKFQARLNPATPGVASQVALQGLQKMYQQMSIPDNAKTKQLRTNLLTAMVKLFDEAGSLVAGFKHGIRGCGAYKADLQRLSFTAHVLANLRYKRADEPLFILYHINQALSRRSAGVQSDLQNLLVKKKLIRSDDDEDVDSPNQQQVQQSNTQANPHNTRRQAGTNNAANRQANGMATADGHMDGVQVSPGTAGRIRIKSDPDAEAHRGPAQSKMDRLSDEPASAERAPASDAAGQVAEGGQEGAGPSGTQGRVGLEELTDEQLQEVLVVKAAAAVSGLLVLKQYIKAAYYLTDDRIAGFSPVSERRKQEEKTVVSKRSDLRAFSLEVVNLNAPEEGMEAAVKLYQTLKGLMDNDASNYREQALIDAYNADRAEGGEAAAEEGDANQGLLLYSMEAGRRGRGRGRGAR